MKFFTLDFLSVLLLMGVVFIVHEWGHYIAYRSFGIAAYFKKSWLIPQVLPKEPATLNRTQGLVIALSGFFVSTLLIILPLVWIYPLWKVLLVGSIGGSVVDFFWAFTILCSGETTVEPKY